jgi:hypothetical protein
MMLRRLGHDVSYESAHVPGDEAGAIHHAAAAGDRAGHRTWLRHGTRPLTLPAPDGGSVAQPGRVSRPQPLARCLRQP